MGDPSSLETLTRTHILIMALDAVIDELPSDLAGHRLAVLPALVGLPRYLGPRTIVGRSTSRDRAL
jgi:hypothetical protein